MPKDEYVVDPRPSQPRDRRAMVRNPVWPTILWSGLTLRSVTCHGRIRVSKVSMCRKPAGSRASTTCWTCTVVGR